MTLSFQSLHSIFAMVAMVLNSLPRSFSILAANNFKQVARSNPARLLVFSNGETTLHFAFRSLHVVKTTEYHCIFKRGVSKRNKFRELGGRGGVRGICFCKHEEAPEEESNSENKGVEKLDWSIWNRWDVPWDWKTTLFTMTACGLSFLFTGLAEITVISFLRVRQGHMMSLDERATLLFVDQFLITAVGLAVIYTFVNRYKPLPNDLFSFEWKEPLNLYNGWLLYGGIGLIAAAVGVSLAGVALSALNGEPPPRETDALMQLLPLIGASNVSTASLIGVTGIMAPLYEETVFRGYLMTSLTKWFPTPIAVIFSASIFALAHLTPGEFPQLFMLGIVLGFSYAQTRNLLTPITIHAFWNSGVVLLLTLLRLQGYDIQDLLQ